MTISDANAVPDGADIRADVCIAGAGAAGITLARALTGTGRTVALLESGGYESDATVQELYRGESVGEPYEVEWTRLRQFGGTTNHWGGWCRPFDPEDFAEKQWLGHSGWPFGRDTLDGYYESARAVCAVSEGPFDARQLFGDARYGAAPLVESRAVTTWVYRYSVGPLRFGEAYRADLDRAQNVTVLLGANVVRIENENGRRVRAFEVATFAGRRFRVLAGSYVLAAGGIENARMLLVGGGDGNPIGNDHDLVGRYFMDHAETIIGRAVLTGPVPGNFLGGRVDHLRTAIALTPEVVEAERLTSTSFVFDDVRSESDERVAADDVASVLAAIETEPTQPYSVQIRPEPEPNPDSRVTLGEDVDRLGVPRVRLRWLLAPDDRPRMRRAAEVLARELAAAGRGWLRLEPPDLGAEHVPTFYGSHHMGTTRMDSDPTRGVVDPDCRVHGVDNLYVAGSSVFPTAGAVNPTLTIVALALRLADRLRLG